MCVCERETDTDEETRSCVVMCAYIVCGLCGKRVYSVLFVYHYVFITVKSKVTSGLLTVVLTGFVWFIYLLSLVSI